MRILLVLLSIFPITLSLAHRSYAQSLSDLLKPGNSKKQNAIEIVLRERLRSDLKKLLSLDAPVSPKSRLYSTVQNLPGDDFSPSPNSINLLRRFSESKKGIVHLEPGDYSIPIRVYCMKHSASSPSNHQYNVGQFEGRLSETLTQFHTRGAQARLNPRDIQVVSWNIQAGMKYDEMPNSSRAIIDSVIPDQKSQLNRSLWENIEFAYNRLAPQLKLNSLDTELNNLGDVGKSIKELREARRALLQYNGNYEQLMRQLTPPGTSNRAGGFMNTPWSRVNNRVYERMVVTGSAGSVGTLQIRVIETPGSESSCKEDRVEVPITTVVGDPGTGNVQPLLGAPEIPENLPQPTPPLEEPVDPKDKPSPAPNDLGFLSVPEGQFTFDSEGSDDPDSPWYTRKPHVPTDRNGKVIGDSGVTLGRGADLGKLPKAKVYEIMKESGLSESDSKLISEAAGLRKQAAKNWLDNNRDRLPELTREQQNKLFQNRYSFEKSETERILRQYEKIEFSELSPKIQDILVDLKFRGDLSPSRRKQLSPSLRENNFENFRNIIENSDIWTGKNAIPAVPKDRFDRRKDYLRPAQSLI